MPAAPPLGWRQGGRGRDPSCLHHHLCQDHRGDTGTSFQHLIAPLTPGSLGTRWASRGLQPPALFQASFLHPRGTGSRSPHTCSHRHRLLPERMIQGSPEMRGCREAPISLRFTSRGAPGLVQNPTPRRATGCLASQYPAQVQKVFISNRNLTRHCLNNKVNCRGPAPADPGYSKERRHRRGSGNNCLIKL